MTAVVLDASVMAAAFFQEEHAPAAQRLLQGAVEVLHAPDLIYAELGNVIWKRYSRGAIALEKASDLLADMRLVPLEITPSRNLVESALEIALKLNHSVYDCLYLALALSHNCALITGDQRLIDHVAPTAFRKHIKWIGKLR
ncbi:MAG: type II toxin-antitoxin system VapC family toxin [Planctomycetaceae bacterium]|nr:type II toxin-antitoxin system VapC family toxin [Planctomycetaceae bacterium]